MREAGEREKERKQEEGGEKGGRELRCERRIESIREKGRKQRGVLPFHCLCYDFLRPQSEWEKSAESLGIPWECWREGLDFQDALGLAVAALHPGWEDQDLGLPLLHVLGKNSGDANTVWASGETIGSAAFGTSENKNFNSFALILDDWFLEVWSPHPSGT